MDILADECLDYGIVKALKSNGYDVSAIVDLSPGIDDAAVLKKAYEQGALLITEDKDFGELVHRLQLPHKGILLINLTSIPRVEMINFTVESVKNHFHELKNRFSVLNGRGLRIKN